MHTSVLRACCILRNVLSVSLFILCLLVPSLAAADFDHQYDEYDRLLKEVVEVSDNKKQTRVDYQRLSINKTRLSQILNTYSAVSKSHYDTWAPEQQLSFLINAYNGFTLQLIVDNWSKFTLGKVESIRDLGNLFTTPWQKSFFDLFGKKHNLDDIEHEMVRKWFKEPRIHAALVCAAVSCPPLRDEAFVATQLSEQLESQMQLFLADNSRNEIVFYAHKGSASLSSIFKWYQSDFEKGHGEFSSLYDVLNHYSEALVQDDSNAEAQRTLIQSADYPILFKDYDWRLNDVANF